MSIMRHTSTIPLLTTSHLQMMAKRRMIDPQVPGGPPKSLVPDGGFQVPKRNCPKLRPPGPCPDFDPVFPKRQMDGVLRRPQDGGDIADGPAFPDVKLDQVRFRWRRTSRRTSPLHFQPGGFLIFDPTHENYSRSPASFIMKLAFGVMASLSSGRLAMTRPSPPHCLGGKKSFPHSSQREFFTPFGNLVEEAGLPENPPAGPTFQDPQ